MLNLYCKLKALRATRDQGVTTVEYALILLTVVLVIGGILWGFSQTISDVFTRTCTALQGNC